MYTSGTTIGPKGVMLTTENITGNRWIMCWRSPQPPYETAGRGRSIMSARSISPALPCCAGRNVSIQRDFDPAQCPGGDEADRLDGAWLAAVMTTSILTVRIAIAMSLQPAMGGSAAAKKLRQARIRSSRNISPTPATSTP